MNLVWRVHFAGKVNNQKGMTVVHFDFDKLCKSNSDLRTAYVEMNTYKHKSHIIVQQENIDNLISIHDQKLENSQPACNIIFVGRFSQSINLTYKKQIYKFIWIMVYTCTIIAYSCIYTGLVNLSKPLNPPLFWNIS